MKAAKGSLMAGAGEALDFGELVSGAADIAGLSGEKPRLVQALPLDAITAVSPVQARAPFDPAGDPADAEFLASIQAEGGNHEPVWAAPLEDQPGEYQLIAGHRRVDALRAAGLETARALVWPAATTQAQRDKLTFLENYHRKDLSTAETAQALHRLMDRYSYKLREAAEVLGISLGHAHNLKAVADGPAEVRALVADGLVGAATASQLARLEPGQRASAADAIRQGRPAREALEEAGQERPVKPAVRKKAGPPPGDPLLELLADGQAAELAVLLERTGVANVFTPEDVRLMALLRLSMPGDGWDKVVTAFSTLLRADRRALRSILAAADSLLRLKAYADPKRWKRLVRIYLAAAERLAGKAGL